MSERALIVDEDADSRAALAAVLEDEGYEVVAVAGGREGLEAVDGQRFDLVVSDYHMSDMNGGVFVRSVLGRHPDVYQLLLTRPGQRTVSLIGVPVLRTPVQPEVLRLVLERHCNHVRRGEPDAPAAAGSSG